MVLPWLCGAYHSKVTGAEEISLPSVLVLDKHHPYKCIVAGSSTATLTPHARHNDPCILVIFKASLTKSLQGGDCSTGYPGAGAGADTITPYYEWLKGTLSESVSGPPGLHVLWSLLAQRCQYVIPLLPSLPSAVQDLNQSNTGILRVSVQVHFCHPCSPAGALYLFISASEQMIVLVLSTGRS